MVQVFTFTTLVNRFSNDLGLDCTPVLRRPNPS